MEVVLTKQHPDFSGGYQGEWQEQSSIPNYANYQGSVLKLRSRGFVLIMGMARLARFVIPGHPHRGAAMAGISVTVHSIDAVSQEWTESAGQSLVHCHSIKIGGLQRSPDWVRGSFLHKGVGADLRLAPVGGCLQIPSCGRASAI